MLRKNLKFEEDVESSHRHLGLYIIIASVIAVILIAICIV